METTMLQITSFVRDVASSGANYISHTKKVIWSIVVTKMLPQPITTLFDRSVYLGLNLFTNNGHHYNIVNSP